MISDWMGDFRYPRPKIPTFGAEINVIINELNEALAS